MNPFFLVASFVIGFTAGSFIVAHSYSSLRCVQAMIEDGKAHCVAYVDKDFIR